MPPPPSIELLLDITPTDLPDRQPWLGQALRILLRTIDADTKAAVAATGVQIAVRQPGAAARVIYNTGQMEADGTGRWVLTLTATAAGRWRIRGECAGPSAATQERVVDVRGSQVVVEYPPAEQIVTREGELLTTPDGAAVVAQRVDRLPAAGAPQAEDAMLLVRGGVALAGAVADLLEGAADAGGAAGATAGTTAGAAAGTTAGAAAGAAAGTTAGTTAGAAAGTASAEAALATRVPFAGGTMTGPLRLVQPAPADTGDAAATVDFVRNATAAAGFVGAIARSTAARLADRVDFRDFGTATASIPTGQAAIDAAVMAAVSRTGPQRLDVPPGDIAMRRVPRLFRGSPRIVGAVGDIQGNPARFSCYAEPTDLDGLVRLDSVRTARISDINVTQRGRAALTISIGSTAANPSQMIVCRTAGSGTWVSDGWSGAGQRVLLTGAAPLPLTLTLAEAPGNPGAAGARKQTIRTIDTAGNLGAVRAGGVTEFRTTQSHDLAPGDRVVVFGVANTSFNGFFVVATTPTASRFTVANAGADATSGGGTASQNFITVSDAVAPLNTLSSVTATMAGLKAIIRVDAGANNAIGPVRATVDAAARTITLEDGATWDSSGATSGQSVTLSGFTGAAAGNNGRFWAASTPSGNVLTLSNTFVVGPGRIQATAGGAGAGTFTLLDASLAGSTAAVGRPFTLSGWNATYNNTTWTIAGINGNVLTVAEAVTNNSTSGTGANLTIQQGTPLTSVTSAPLIYATFASGPALSSYMVVLDGVGVNSTAAETEVGDLWLTNAKWVRHSHSTFGNSRNAVTLGDYYEDNAASLVNGAVYWPDVERDLLNGHVEIRHASMWRIDGASFEENARPADPPSVLVRNVRGGSTTAADMVICGQIIHTSWQHDIAGADGQNGGATTTPVYEAGAHRPGFGLGGHACIDIQLCQVRNRGPMKLGSWHGVRSNYYYLRTPGQSGILIPATDPDGRVITNVEVARTNYFHTNRGVAVGIVDERRGTVVRPLGDVGLPFVRRMAVTGGELWRVGLEADRALPARGRWVQIDTFALQEPWPGGAGGALISLVLASTSGSAEHVRARLVLAQRLNPRLSLAVLGGANNTSFFRTYGRWDDVAVPELRMPGSGYQAGDTVRFARNPALANINTDFVVQEILNGGNQLRVGSVLTTMPADVGFEEVLLTTVSGSTITRSGGSWLTRGWTGGDIGYLDGYGGGATGNNLRQLDVTGATRTTLTVAQSLVTVGAPTATRAYRGEVVAMATASVPAGGYATLYCDQRRNTDAVVTADPPLVSLEVFVEGAAAETPPGITLLGNSVRGTSGAAWRRIE